MIEVYCIRGNGDKEMGDVSDQLLSSTQAAIKRGTYEINKQYFLVHQQSLDVPLKQTTDSTAIMDGDIITISDKYLGISGNRKVRGITLSGTSYEVRMVLEIESFEERE